MVLPPMTGVSAEPVDGDHFIPTKDMSAILFCLSTCLIREMGVGASIPVPQFLRSPVDLFFVCVCVCLGGGGGGGGGDLWVPGAWEQC